MPKYLFDTNMCIYLMKNQPEQVARRFAQLFVGDVVMSSITFAELAYGASTSARPRRERNNLAALVKLIEVAPFDEAAASAYGPIRAATRERKHDALDKLIAAHAVALGVPVVTNNVRDFTHYPGVKIENWLDGPA
ncbi:MULTISPECIES: type II toxin-antitoxin system VapC family toxin [unclassified Caballeronia]|uniref:type II toxin-antitoxin system VapC family toxin n=1 Tax=unclassified Caballeronia TaxID=2646786 RepID=UPI001FD0F8A6|nr:MULTISPECIES: type II toxin-antitoxin system VapC family toxin [unclassified Caballeronia]MDR5773748.1 type II toxin-antitoxin system VapC family toxin [Caballeronia sp. LZ002]MDR5849183.1 type II toxin-antitoxin system VapC family toxin [Caballeronia sp. LZ003]